MTGRKNLGSGINLKVGTGSSSDFTLLTKNVNQPNFLGHCVFCLRKTTTKRQGDVCVTAEDSTELLHVVPKAEVASAPPSLLNTFNRIWLPLQKRIEGSGEDEDPFGFLHTSAGGSKSTKSSVFTSLPRLCKFCAEKLEAVDKLLNDLLSEMNGLRKIIQESRYGGKYSWRASEFEAALTNSSMEEGPIRATLKFLDDLGKNTVKYEADLLETILKTEEDSASDHCSDSSHDDVDNILSRMDIDWHSDEREMPCGADVMSTTAPNAAADPLELCETGLEASKSNPPFDTEDTPSDQDCGNDPDNDRSEDETDSSSDSEDERIDSHSTNIESNSKCQKAPTPECTQKDERRNRKSRTSSGKDFTKLKLKTYTKEVDPQTGKMKYTCLIDGCGKTYLIGQQHKKTPSVLRDHQLIHHEHEMNSSSGSQDEMSDPEYTPHDLKIKTKSRASLGKTVKYTKEQDFDTGKFKYTCVINVCGKIYFTHSHKIPPALIKHQTEDHEVPDNIDPTATWVCDLCQRIFKSRMGLRDHKRKTHGTKAPLRSNQQCDLCRQTVPSKDLYQHVQAHVGDDYVIRCPNANCPFACVSPRGLTDHFKSCKACVDFTPDALTHPCEVCGNRIGNALLRMHLINEHETTQKNFQCPIEGCQMRFTVKQSVSCHLPHHDLCSNNITSQRCPHCNTKYKIEDMAEHLKERHQIQEIIKCHQCPQLFSSRELLVDHLYTHRFGNLTCDICGDEVKFYRHSKLREHYFQVHKIGEQHSCQQCDKVYYTKETLRWHKKQQHSEAKLKKKEDEQKEEFMCQECGVIYKHEITLREHNIKHHGAEPYSCGFCSETFTSRTLLNKHQRSHKGFQDKDPEFKCDVDDCGKIFKTKRQLQNHINIRHLNLKEHVCETCGKAYVDAKGLRDHKQIVHEGLRPYACDICEERFASGTTLKQHKLIHTGERPYACDICGQRFRQSGVLHNHLKGHKRKGADFKPSGPMKVARKRVERN